jgi:hypothetical protein
LSWTNGLTAVEAKVPLPLSLLGHDIMWCCFLIFLPASKEVDSTEVVRANMAILYKLEREL